jgi:hypothetical protein
MAEDSNLFAMSGRLVSPSSEDSVSSLSLDDTSTFSYCNNRSNRKLRSRLALSKRRCVDRRSSWKHSFSCEFFYILIIQWQEDFKLELTREKSQSIRGTVSVLRKTVKILSQECWCPGQDMNEAPPQHEASALPLCQLIQCCLQKVTLHK